MMAPERWQQVNQLFHSALACDPSERAALLAQACSGDAELRQTVEALLASYETPGSFINSPPLVLAAEVFNEDKVELAEGQAVGHYQIIRPLGEGGMGVVHLAEDHGLNRKVAIKLLPALLAADPQLRARFLREARLASALNHPNICTIYEIAEDNNQYFIAMQYVEGQTLKEVIDGRPLSLDNLLSISLQVADALAAAHEQGIIHRDIKSSNIIITPQGQAIVLDFGLAKSLKSDQEDSRSGLTQTGEMLGTPSYMSPEQARGERVDQRSDIFSFGVVLYEMATGRVPFKEKSTVETMNAVINEPHRPVAEYNPGIPPQLSAIIDRALAKDPADRYQSSREIISDLRHVVTQGGGLEQMFNAADLAGEGIPYVPLKRRAGLAQFRRWARNLRRMMPLAFATVVALVGLMFLTYYLFLRPPPAPKPTANPAPIRAIAVLPFKPLVADNRDEALELGMADSVIFKLSNLRELIVRPISSVRKYTAIDRDPIAAGREQGVDAVLDASLQTAGERVRVSARLLSVNDGATLWAYKCDEQQCANLFDLQDAIAEKVAGALVRKLSGEDRELLAKRYTDNTEAFRLYSTGRVLWSKYTRDAVKKSIEYYERAIAIDPNYALAYAGIADSYSELGGWLGEPIKENLPKAKEAALKAIEIDETLAEAHCSLGRAQTIYGRDWTVAERELKRALELNPNSGLAHQIYGVYLSIMGRWDEAIAEAQRGQELEPFSFFINYTLGSRLYYARQYDQAIEQWQKALELEPNNPRGHYGLQRAYLCKGMVDKAVAEFDRADHLWGTDAKLLAARRKAYATGGLKGYLRKRLEQMKESAKRPSAARHSAAFDCARMCALLGETDQAFAWLEKAYEEDDPNLNFLKGEPELDSLRDDPRFTDLQRRLGLS